jgi:serine/threonine-protein kinase
MLRFDVRLGVSRQDAPESRSSSMGTHQLAPGTVLGRYELLLPIASGGMATVWVARLKGSRGFSKTVAVKTILPSLSDDPTFEQMFLDEATLASKIQHPNVAHIIDLGEEDEVLFLAMEWVDGESLSTLSKFSRKNGTDIPLRVGLKIASQAAAGLHAAHELRDDDDRLLELVHRDVSPQNILVSSTGLVKIVDFGVAKAMGRGGETTAGQLKGKVPFMSPEQARGAKVDRRTDIFALGIILYRLATGTHPFLDDNDIRTMRNIITRPVMPPRVKNPSLSPEIERVILKALAKDPDKRPQTAAELEIELEAAIASTRSGRSCARRSASGIASVGRRSATQR